MTSAPGAGVGLPLRVGADGRLARGEPRETLVRMIRVMAATPAATWPHAPWFGLQEVFASARLQLAEQEGIADALNAAFRALGVRWARVAYVHTVGGDAYGERTFRIGLEVEGGRIVHDDVAV